MERRDAEIAEAATRKYFREVSAHLNHLAERVIGAAIAVHRELGPGFLESTYEAALEVEMDAAGIAFERQVSIPVSYRGREVACSRLDYVIDHELVLELKAVEELRPLHRAQVLSYLRAGGFELGLLINFNVSTLRTGVRRVVWTR